MRAVRHALGRRLGRFAAPLLVLAVRPARPPARLLIAPQDIRVADPTVAADIYAGHFALADAIVDAHGRSPFAVEPPSPAWAEALHGFSWLRHLRAADTALGRANARALVDDWIAAARTHPRAEAWRTEVVARRLLTWLSHSPMILEGADGRFYGRLMRSLAGQAAVLRRRQLAGLDGDARLWVTLALAAFGLCTDRSADGGRADQPFLRELERQVLPDGGHISRDPQVLVDLLLDVLPLRQAYAARGVAVPSALLNAIDRMVPMLRMLRHADGSLALFNGMGASQPEAIATVLVYDDARGQPLANAPYSGYQRLVEGGSVVVCDTGPPPPTAFSGRAHAGTLAFEFSTAGHLLVVNCGHPAGGSAALALAARSTAAHSTLVLDDLSSSRFAGAGAGALAGTVVDGPAAVPVRRSDEPGRALMVASHDGYAARGFLHRRTLALEEAGNALHGEDALEAGGGAAGRPGAFDLRFHLHPAVRPAPLADGRGAVLTLPGGAAWLFEAGGLDVAVEESLYLGGPEGARRTGQLVVRGEARAGAAVRWSFTALPAAAQP